MVSTVNKAQVSTSSTTIKLRASSKSTKSLDMHKFLIKYHSEDHIHLFGAINNHWNWYRQIRNSNVANKEGLVIFLGKDDQVLYIGHTSHIASYFKMIKYSYNINPIKIFIVCNENPSKYVHAVTAYRAKFKPLLNSERNTRFMFDSTTTVLNLNSRSEKVLDWIKRHPNSTRQEFILVFNQQDLATLCKCFNSNKISYKELKAKVFKTKNNIKVVSQQELLNA